jgi:hypothetical protein
MNLADNSSVILLLVAGGFELKADNGWLARCWLA